jgi:hypothetical protein
MHRGLHLLLASYTASKLPHHLLGWHAQSSHRDSELSHRLRLGLAELAVWPLTAKYLLLHRRLHLLLHRRLHLLLASYIASKLPHHLLGWHAHSSGTPN